MRNDPLIELAQKHKILVWCPPSHTSAARLTSQHCAPRPPQPIRHPCPNQAGILTATDIPHPVTCHLPPTHLQPATCNLHSGGTQQCDLSTKRGGVIARLKVLFRKFLRKQFRASLERKERRGAVSVAEIAALLEKAANESWDPESGPAMNSQVGYFTNAQGLLQWDPLRDEDPDAAADAGAGASSTSTRNGRAHILAQQESQRNALTEAQP